MPGALKSKLQQKVPEWRKQRQELLAHGEEKLADLKVIQVMGGLRGLPGLVCDTSVVSPDQGLVVRGIPIGELSNRLPEEMLYLLLTGELPGREALDDLRQELSSRARIPGYVWKVLEALPHDTHPMAMFSVALLALERESVFRRHYEDGMPKEQYWESTLEDCLQLLARLPAVAAGIYRLHIGQARLPSRPELDWGADFAQMLGVEGEEFAQLMRLYLTLHCDHEGGNVSAFTSHTVGSALSDAYYAVAAGLNGLAGPLHGLANQESLHFVLDIENHFGGAPSEAQLSGYIQDRLQHGQVIPGYGHAVLRVTDPRYSAFHQFGERYCRNEQLFNIVDRLFAVVPNILKQQARVQDPWPNVDAISGSLLYHYGLKEFDYYTVLFGVSRALGLCSQLILNRAVGTPIMRPKSVSTRWLLEHVTVPSHVS